MNQRLSGILLHPTSPSNPYPIGDLGPAATAFADFMVKSEQRWWQNFPGIMKGNWRWRLKDGALTHELAQRLRSITITYGRLRSGEPPVSGR